MSDKVEVKKGIDGLGLFATEPFTRGDLVIEYTGEKITNEEAQQRGGKYLFELDDEWTLDGKDRAHNSRYMNHACKPNCYAELDEETLRIFIYAKKKIAPGEELTYHYGKQYFKDYIEPKGCRCDTCAGR